ncbi:MAG: metal ion permease [Photobacterium aquimaris]|nr:metal ion permease [Photobacterium aquimaris]
MGHDISGLVIHVFSTFGNMIWQIFWPLAFGLILSSWIRNLIPVSSVVKHLGKTTPVSLGFTTFLGMVSSSCSYAAASLSHTLLVKKSTVANAMAFLVSSTNLIVEMFIVLVALMGWTFLWGEVIGGLILIATVGFLFSRFFPQDVEQELRQHLEDAQPQKASCGMDMFKMKSDDSDCDMDMAAKPQSATMEKITKSAGFFQMDIAMIGKEILIGVVVSSILIALMPQDGWRALFISNDAGLPVWLHSFLDVIIGIFVAMIAYVCSVGNLILAAALWHGGISFGGVIGFILSDVLTIPMIRVYQKYYGKRPAKWMVGLLFVAILFTGLCVDAIFNGFGWVTSDQTVRALNQSGFGFNMTTVMNLIFIPASIWYYYLGKKANAGMGMSM